MKWLLLILILIGVMIVEAKEIQLIPETPKGIITLNPELFTPMINMVSDKFSFSVEMIPYIENKQGNIVEITQLQSIFFKKLTDTDYKFNISIKNLRNIPKAGIRINSDIPCHLGNETMIVCDNNDMTPALNIDFSDLYGIINFTLNSTNILFDLNNVDEINLDPFVNLANAVILEFDAAIVNETVFVLFYIESAGDDGYVRWFYTDGTPLTAELFAGSDIFTQTTIGQTIAVEPINTTMALLMYKDWITNDLTYFVRNQSGLATRNEVDIDTDTGLNPKISSTSHNSTHVSAIYFDNKENTTSLVVFDSAKTTMHTTYTIQNMDTSPYRIDIAAINDSASLLVYANNYTKMYQMIKYNTLGTAIATNLSKSGKWTSTLSAAITTSRYNSSDFIVYFANESNSLNATTFNIPANTLGNNVLVTNKREGMSVMFKLSSSYVEENVNQLIFLNKTGVSYTLKHANTSGNPLSTKTIYNLSNISINSAVNMKILANETNGAYAICNQREVVLFQINNTNLLTLLPLYYNLTYWDGTCPAATVTTTVCCPPFPNDYGVDFYVNASCYCTVQNISYCRSLWVAGTLVINGTLNVSCIYGNSTGKIYGNSTGRIYANRSSC